MRVSRMIEIMSEANPDDEIVALWWDKETFLTVPDEIQVTDEMLEKAEKEVLDNTWVQEQIWEMIWEVIIENQKESN